MAKYCYEIKEISKELALELIQQYHYSRTLPRLNKYFVGFYLDDLLCGVVTLGWGTRPLHTIQKLFPSLTTADYLEIGRMAMTDEMPRNSESQMLSQLIKWLKANHPEIKILFTWADGMLGKVGYVYQASNFIYAGYVGGEMYLKDGYKIHVRQTRHLFSPNDERLTVRPTLEQMRINNINHYKGRQYRYFYYLCNRTEKKKLSKEYLLPLDLKRPKDKDLIWEVRDNVNGRWYLSDKPPYKTDLDKEDIEIKETKLNYKQLSLFD